MKFKKESFTYRISLYLIHCECTTETELSGWQSEMTFTLDGQGTPTYELTYKQKEVINPVNWIGIKEGRRKRQNRLRMD